MRCLFPRSVISVAVCLVLLAATFVASGQMRKSQTQRLSALTLAITGSLAVKLEQHIAIRLGVVDLIKFDWEQGQISSVDEFRAKSQATRELFDDLQALNWVSAEGVIEVVTPVAGNEPALGLNVRALEVPRAALTTAARTGQWAMTPQIDLAQGGKGFVAYAAIRRDGVLIGFLNVVLRSAPMLEAALASGSGHSFYIEVHQDGRPVHGSIPEDVDRATLKRSEIEIGGRRWAVLAAPRARLVAATGSFLDELAIIVGCLTALAAYAGLNYTAIQQDRLRRSEERFDYALRGANDGLWDWDRTSDTLYFSPRYLEMLGYRNGELPTEHGTFLSLLHPDDLERVRSYPEDIIAASGEFLESEFRLRHKNGEWVDILSRAYVVRSGKEVVRIVGTHLDITQTKRQQVELEKAAMTDDLTGLRNRRGLTEMLTTIVADMTPRQRLAVLHLDLDKFKSINDTLGHEAGDQVLIRTARRLESNRAKFDVIARIGGDEFLMAKVTSLSDENIGRLCEQVVSDISEPMQFNGRVCNFGASVGVAFYTTSGDLPIDQSIADADIALNAAKTAGRGVYRVFSEAMRAQAVEVAMMSSEIREGLRNGEFGAYLQPQIDVATGRLSGFEALARWFHPTRGVLTAETFVGVAGEAGLIDDIDTEVYVSAFRQIEEISRNGYPDVRIGINVSTAQLSDPMLVEKLIWATDAAQIDARRVGIELLESTMLDDRSANVIENIHCLDRCGFSIELDDFGTGHAAIANLRQFPVQRIKIDRSLISNIDRDPELQIITSAIVGLAKTLNIEVLAEGIETEREYLCMARMGCAVAQGFFVARPMSLDECLEWLRDGPRLSIGAAPRTASA